MQNIPKWPVGILALAIVFVSAAFAGGAEKVEKQGWKWSRLNPFRVDDTKSIRPAASRKIVPNRFKPTRSAAKPKNKKSPWQTVTDSTRKMVDGTRKMLNIGGAKKTDSARNRRAPTLADKPSAKKKTSYTSWLPWSKAKKR